MSPTAPRATQLPRAGIDPIGDDAAALAVVRAAAAQPARHETIVVVLDQSRRGIALVVVGDTVDPDSILEVAERILDPAVHDGRVGAAFIASIRPAGGWTESEHRDLTDAERWLDLDEIASAHDVELLEWYVLSRGRREELSRPRELVNAPPRW